MADTFSMATVGGDEAVLAQVRAIQDYQRVEHDLHLLYCAEREASVPEPEAFERALRQALDPDAYERVRSLLAGELDTEGCEVGPARDNLIAHAEEFWYYRRLAIREDGLKG